MSDAFDHFVPDPEVRREFGDREMTMWRFDRDPVKIALGWPAKIKIGQRNFRSRSQLEAFKKNLIVMALAAREAQAKDTAP